MKVLKLIFVVACLCNLSASAGTWFGASITGMDSIKTATGTVGIGFDRAAYHMAMSSDGDLYMVVWNHSGNKAQVFTMNDWDEVSPVFTCNNNVFSPIGLTGISDHLGIWVFGDSAFSLSASDGATTPNVIRKFVDRTIGLMDTVDGNSTSGGVRGGVNVMGNGTSVLVLHSRELATDSLYLFQTDGPLAQGSSYINRAQRLKLSGGLRVPFRLTGGRQAFFTAWDVDLSDLFEVDTTGWATLTTNFLPDDLPGIGSGYGEMMCWMIPVVDSYFVVGWQTALTPASSCILSSRSGHISNYSSVVWDNTAQTLLGAGNVPGGFACCPLFSKMPGLDSVIAVYIRWPDTTAKSAREMSYRISTDKGLSWGNQMDFGSVPAGCKAHELQMPPALGRRGDSTFVAVGGLDSLTASPGDSMTVFIGSIVTTPAASEHRTRTLQYKKKGT